MNEKISKSEVLLFRCNQCCEELSPDSLTQAIALKGFFVLIASDKVAFGITCPNCGGTSFDTFDKNYIESIKENLLHGTEGTYFISGAQFRYHSFPYTLDYHNENLAGIVNSYSKFSDIDTLTVEEEEVLNPERYPSTGLPKGYCSYFFGDQAIGPCMIIYWFQEDHINELVKRENETGLRIFPRYIAYDPLYNAIESFCWDYFLSSRLAENIGMVFSGSNNMTVREQGLGRGQKFFKRDADFAKVLIIKQPDLDLLSDMSNPQKHNMNMRPTAKRENYADTVLSGLDKGYGRDFFDTNYLSFINEYIELTQRTTFSFEAACKLKNHYLKQLAEHMRGELLSNVQYAFFEEPPTWTIIFDGKPIRMLKGEGFRYIHYLAEHIRQEIDVHDLNALLGVSVSLVPSSDKNYGYDSEHNGNDEKHFNDGNFVCDSQKIGDHKYYIDLIKRKNELIHDYEEAKGNCDLGKQACISEEIEKIESMIREIRRPDGEFRGFKDDTKRISDKIGRSITRAFNQLSKSNQKAADHFKDAIKPYSNPISYKPREDIKWHLG